MYMCVSVRLFRRFSVLSERCNSHEAENRSQRFQSNVQCRVLRVPFGRPRSPSLCEITACSSIGLHSRFALCSQPFFADLSRKITIVWRNCSFSHPSRVVCTNGWMKYRGDQMLLTNYVRFDRLSRTANLLVPRVILSSE